MPPTIVLVHGAFAESAGASHAIAVSRPDATVHPILEATALRAAA
jgi:hypothetical protein